MTENLSNIKIPTNEVIHEATEILLKDGLVAFPTETVYGLGADTNTKHEIAKKLKIDLIITPK